MKLTLRPAGRGRWRPLVIEVVGYPRMQGQLFRGTPYRGDSIDADRALAKVGDEWQISGRRWRVAKVASS